MHAPHSPIKLQSGFIVYHSVPKEATNLSENFEQLMFTLYIKNQYVLKSLGFYDVSLSYRKEKVRFFSQYTPDSCHSESG